MFVTNINHLPYMKAFYSLTLLVLLLAFAPALSAQDAATYAGYHNAITLTVGLNRGLFRDENFSPLNYRSGGNQLGLGYVRTNKNGHRITADVNFGLNGMSPGFELPDNLTRFQVDLSVGYLRAVSDPRSDHQNYVGVKFRSRLDLSIYAYYESVTFYALHGFEIAAETERKVANRLQLRGGASLPVFGLLSRPPYSGWDKFIADNSDNIPKVITRGDWLTIGSFLGLRGHLGLAYEAGKHWKVESRYSLAYYTTKRLDPVRMLDHTFSFNTTLNF